MFRNLLIFKVTNLPAPNKIAEAIAQKPLRACGPLEEETSGFVTPDENRMSLGDGEILAGDWLVTINHCGLFAIGQEKKRVPGKLVAKETKRQVQAYFEANGKKASRQVRAEIKQKIKEGFLAKAFAIPARALGYFDFQRGYVVFNSSSRKAGEKMLSTLREALGTLEATELTTRTPMEEVLTGWVQDEANVLEGWAIGDKMSLADPKGGSIKVAGEDLRSEELLAHLKEGKQVTSLAVEWQGRIKMTIDQSLVVRGLKFDHATGGRDGSGTPQEQGGGTEGQSGNQAKENQSVSDLTSDFLLLTGEAGEILDEFKKHWLAED